MPTPTERHRFEPKSAEALRRSRGAHQASLLFAAASEKGTGYPASGAMQAIHVSIAYRHRPYDATLPEMARWLLNDEEKMGNLLDLAQHKHDAAGARPKKGWRTEAYDIIETVFNDAHDFLAVEEGVLRGYYRFYPNILEDLRKPVDQQRQRERYYRTALRRLAGVYGV